MNTWRDIKIAPVLESILATDGNHVYCGCIDNKAGEDVFIGYDLQEMEMEELFLFAIKGWQPIPDTWKPEKTADQMFRELGYKQRPQCPGVYEEGEYHPSGRFTRICVGKASVYKDLVFPAGSTHNEPFSPSEILACAKLIQEMEAKHEER